MSINFESLKNTPNAKNSAIFLIVIVLVAAVLLFFIFPTPQEDVEPLQISEESFSIDYAGFELGKLISVSASERIETVSMQNIYRGDFVLYTVIPKSLASTVGAVEFSSNKEVETIRNDPLIKSTVTGSDSSLELQMKFASSKKLSTINVMFPGDFIDGLSEGELEDLVEVMNLFGQLDYTPQEANELENELAEAFTHPDAYTEANLAAGEFGDKIIYFEEDSDGLTIIVVMNVFGDKFKTDHGAKYPGGVPDEGTAATFNNSTKKYGVVPFSTVPPKTVDDVIAAGDKWCDPQKIREGLTSQQLRKQLKDEHKEEWFDETREYTEYNALEFEISELLPVVHFEVPLVHPGIDVVGVGEICPNPPIESEGGSISISKIPPEYVTNLKLRNENHEPYLLDVTIDFSKYLKENGRLPVGFDKDFEAEIRVNYAGEGGLVLIKPKGIKLKIKKDPDVSWKDFLFTDYQNYGHKMYFKEFEEAPLIKKPVIAVNNYPFQPNISICGENESMPSASFSTRYVTQESSCNIKLGNNSFTSIKPEMITVQGNPEELDKLFYADIIAEVKNDATKINSVDDYKYCAEYYCTRDLLEKAIGKFIGKFDSLYSKINNNADAYTETWGSTNFSFGTIFKLPDIWRGIEMGGGENGILPAMIYELENDHLGEIVFIKLERNLGGTGSSTTINSTYTITPVFQGHWLYADNTGVTADLSGETIYTFSQRFTPDSACFFGVLGYDVASTLWGKKTAEEISFKGEPKNLTLDTCFGTSPIVSFFDEKSIYAGQVGEEAVYRKEYSACNNKSAFFGDYKLYFPVGDWKYSIVEPEDEYSEVIGRAGGCVYEVITSDNGLVKEYDPFPKLLVNSIDYRKYLDKFGRVFDLESTAQKLEEAGGISINILPKSSEIYGEPSDAGVVVRSIIAPIQKIGSGNYSTKLYQLGLKQAQEKVLDIFRAFNGQSFANTRNMLNINLEHPGLKQDCENVENNGIELVSLGSAPNGIISFDYGKPKPFEETATHNTIELFSFEEGKNYYSEIEHYKRFEKAKKEYKKQFLENFYFVKVDADDSRVLDTLIWDTSGKMIKSEMEKVCQSGQDTDFIKCSSADDEKYSHSCSHTIEDKIAFYCNYTEQDEPGCECTAIKSTPQAEEEFTVNFDRSGFNSIFNEARLKEEYVKYLQEEDNQKFMHFVGRDADNEVSLDAQLLVAMKIFMVGKWPENCFNEFSDKTDFYIVHSAGLKKEKIPQNKANLSRDLEFSWEVPALSKLPFKTNIHALHNPEWKLEVGIRDPACPDGGKAISNQEECEKGFVKSSERQDGIAGHCCVYQTEIEPSVLVDMIVKECNDEASMMGESARRGCMALEGNELKMEDSEFKNKAIIFRVYKDKEVTYGLWYDTEEGEELIGQESGMTVHAAEDLKELIEGAKLMLYGDRKYFIDTILELCEEIEEVDCTATWMGRITKKGLEDHAVTLSVLGGTPWGTYLNVNVSLLHKDGYQEVLANDNFNYYDPLGAPEEVLDWALDLLDLEVEEQEKSVLKNNEIIDYVLELCYLLNAEAYEEDNFICEPSGPDALWISMRDIEQYQVRFEASEFKNVTIQLWFNEGLSEENPFGEVENTDDAEDAFVEAIVLFYEAMHEDTKIEYPWTAEANNKMINQILELCIWYEMDCKTEGGPSLDVKIMHPDFEYYHIFPNIGSSSGGISESGEIEDYSIHFNMQLREVEETIRSRSFDNVITMHPLNEVFVRSILMFNYADPYFEPAE